MIALSTVNYQIPLVCGPGSLLQAAVQQKLLACSNAPPQSMNSHGRKFISTFQVSIMAGRVLDYVHRSKTGFALSEDYTIVDDDMRALAQELIGQHGSHEWTFCDSIAMALR